MNQALGLLEARSTERQSKFGSEIETALQRARFAGSPALLTVLLPWPASIDHLAFLRGSSAELGDGVYWRRPHDEMVLSGAGTALEITALGLDRFGVVAQVIQHLRDNLTGHDGTLPFPILGGLAFDPIAPPSSIWSGFPAARFVVPQVLLQCRAGQAHLRLTVAVDQDESAATVAERLRDLEGSARRWQHSVEGSLAVRRVTGRRSVPEQSAWEHAVGATIARIKRWELAKVVLAREERLRADAPFAPIETLAHLGQIDPSTTRFGMQSGQSWFLGASPERLARLDGDRVDVTCLAGSIASGDNGDEQRILANTLLASAKDREEHEIVVRSTLAALRQVCHDVTRLSGTPRVVAARAVQHLESPLTARLADGTILDLVERLHPTPAVGGHPRDLALSAIRELEPIDRGWYAAPFGWLDVDGGGEFVVAIRSALLTGRTASLFAGCGIVAGSVPADEYAETEIKLGSLLSALGAT